MAIPKHDAQLVAFSANFGGRIAASPTTFALTPAQAAAYSDVYDPYRAAQQALVDARAAGVRSEAMTAARNTARTALLAYARQLYTIVAASAEVADADKALLGVHVRHGRARLRPAPASRPTVGVVSVEGRTVRLALRDSASVAKRAKPDGAAAAWVYAWVGETYPSDLAQWAFHGAATRGTLDVTFADSVAGGARVWFRAIWVNARGERGPAGEPAMTYLQGGGAMPAPAALRIAA